MQQHKIQELFNEMLTNILHNKPSNVKESILHYLHNLERVKQDDPHSL